MKLAMCMKVRNEEDILEDNLRYHAGQGVDVFVVTDNGSTDRTSEILRRWHGAGRLRLFEEPSEEFRERAHWWVTRMARVAATELGADWILHADADEFWWPVEGDLKEAFSQVPGAYGAVLAPRTEFVPRPDEGRSFAERLTIREARSALRPKLAHRPESEIVLRRGAHDLDLERREIARAGRPVLRGLREREMRDDGRLVFAPVFPARVLHFPLRSFDQYKRRVEVMLRGGFEDRTRERLRKAYEEDRLDELYAELAYDDEAVEQGLRAGELVRDPRLSERLPSCPDPTVDGEPADAPPARDWSAEEIEAEREDLTFEGMRALTRTQQFLTRQRDQLRRRLARKDRKLERASRGREGADARRLRAGVARMLRRRRGR